MPRFVDRIWEMRWVPPQLLCYAPAFRTEAGGGWSFSRMRAVMESERDAIGRTSVYACDNIAGYFFATAARDRDLHAEDFPAVAVPERDAFIEFRGRRPEEEAKGDAMLAHLPHWWGWHVTRHTPHDFAEGLGHERIPQGCHHGLLCTLWVAYDDRNFFAPVATFGLYVADDGEVLGPPLRTFGFAHDPDRLSDPDGHLRHFGALFMPLVMVLCFAAYPGTSIGLVVPDKKLNQARIKRKKRPIASYHVFDCGEIQRTLRYDGMAGIQGLTAALRTCRNHFVRQLGTTTGIFLPSGPRR
jgi:hypothetical protein